jgi:hypothetical protein
MLNRNELYDLVAEIEGKKKSVDRAQIAEVGATLLQVLANQYSLYDVIATLHRENDQLLKRDALGQVIYWTGIAAEVGISIPIEAIK